MPVRRTRRSRRFLLVCVLALLLATGLAACNGPSEDDPAPAAPAQAADPAASPASDAPVSPAETPPPLTPPDAPVPDLPAEPAAPTASPLPTAPAISASEPAAAPGELSPLPAESPEPEPVLRSFRYDTYDRSGAVAEPGRYAFLADPGDLSSAVTTYEGLRDGTATALRIHTHDAHGVPQADLYDAVEAGDLVEWKQAADCFVRYTVTSAPTPAAGAVPRSFGVAWMTYAFTGCSGAISTAATDIDVTWGAVLPVLGGTSLTAPIRHGGAQILPRGWTGAVEAEQIVFPPAYNPDPFFWTDNLEEARRLPYWRDPVLPDGWRFGRAGTPGDAVAYGYVAYFISDEGGTGLDLIGRHANPLGWNRPAAWHPTDGSLFVTETRVIAGRPAWVQYSPPGPLHRVSGARLVVFDPATESQYLLDGKNLGFGGAGVDRLIAIAASLFEGPTRVLFYDTLDSAGGVGEPGRYAFLADPGDPSSAVTTYEELRDGTATVLRIHAHDAHGVPQADLYDAVETGDLVEWRQAADCFVRYQVTAVPEPSAAAGARTIGVVWMTYAFTGCSGPIAGDTAATFEWGDLPDLGGASLTAPIRHGISQILPEGWTGVKEEPVYHEPPAANYSYGFRTKNLAEARRLPYWRDPALPAGWTFVSANSGPESVPYGYEAWYRSPHGGLGLLIEGAHSFYRGWPERAVRGYQSRGAMETRVIAGRPAIVIYSPGPNHDPSFSTVVRVYDPATEGRYTLYGYTGSLRGANIDALIAIARSLFESPNSP